MKGEQVREKLAREILRKLRLVRELCAAACLCEGHPPLAAKLLSSVPHFAGYGSRGEGR